MKKSTRIVLSVLIGTVLTALSYYIMLPPLNLQSTGFWMYLLLVIFFYGLPLGVISSIPGAKRGVPSKPKINKIFIAVAAVPVAVMVLGGIISSEFFNATKYAAVIEVTEAEF